MSLGLYREDSEHQEMVMACVGDELAGCESEWLEGVLSVEKG